jgi:hypothetical protein
MNQRDLDQLAREAETPRQRINRDRRERAQIALFRKQLDSLVDAEQRQADRFQK